MGKWEPATQPQPADQPGACVRVWCLTSALVSCPHEYIIVGPKLPSSAHRTRPFAHGRRSPNLARALHIIPQLPRHPPSRPARWVGGRPKARIVLTLPAILPFSSSASPNLRPSVVLEEDES